MITLKSHLEAKSISSETFKGYSAEEKAAVFNEVNEINAKEFNALKEVEGENSKAIAKMSETLVEMKDKQLSELNDALKAQGVVLRKLQAGEGVSEEAASLKSIIGAKKEKLSALKHSSSAMNNVSFELKDAGDMSFGSNVTGQVPQAFRTSGFNDIAQT